MGCFNSKDDRGTHMSYFRSAAEYADEMSDELSEAESDSRSASSDVLEDVPDLKETITKHESDTHKKVTLSKDTTTAITTSNLRSVKLKSRARQRDIRIKALAERKAKHKNLDEEVFANNKDMLNTSHSKNISNDIQIAVPNNGDTLNSDCSSRRIKKYIDTDDYDISNNDENLYEYKYSMSSVVSLSSPIASISSNSISSDQENNDSLSSRSILSKNEVNIGMQSDEDFYQGQEKHALILSLVLYSHNQATVNTKANQLRTILLNYMNYEEEMITVVTNSTISSDCDIYCYIETYIKNTIISSENTHHFFIAVVTDNTFLDDDESCEKLMVEEQLPNDNMIIKIASITNEFTSFCFYLDTPFAGVLPSLKCRAIGDELLVSQQSNENIICTMIAISACSMRNFRGDPYVDACGGEDGMFTEKMAAFARSDCIEQYNWFSFSKQLQQTLDEPQLVSIAVNKRHLLEMPVSL